MQEAPLSVGGGQRVVRPDSLAMAAAEHVRWRPGNTQPDQLLAAERHVALSEDILVHDETPSEPAALDRARFHLAVEAAPRPGRYSAFAQY